MSDTKVLPALFLTGASAVALTALVALSPIAALADQSATKAPPCTAQSDVFQLPGLHVSRPRSSPSQRLPLSANDEIATMAAIQVALTEVADGATYVWHTSDGQLSAIVRPTASFRNSKGRVCRHLHLMLNSGRYSRKSEGVACRGSNRVWSLEG